MVAYKIFSRKKKLFYELLLQITLLSKGTRIDMQYEKGKII